MGKKCLNYKWKSTNRKGESRIGFSLVKAVVLFTWLCGDEPVGHTILTNLLNEKAKEKKGENNGHETGGDSSSAGGQATLSAVKKIDSIDSMFQDSDLLENVDENLS